MKNLWNKCKWIFLFLINVLPFALDVIFYHTGSTDELFLFLPIFAGLTLLNYMNCQKVIPYILYQAFMLICIICAGYASTYLYYHNVSNDFMTPVVGELMTSYLKVKGINYLTMECLIITGAIYFVLNFILSKIMVFVERRMKAHA